MQWEQLALIAFGVVLTLTVDRLKSRWDSSRETKERRDRILSIMATLVLEIEDGISQYAALAELVDTRTNLHWTNLHWTNLHRMVDSGRP